MQIYAKSRLDRTHMISKIDAGCDGIEVQLLNELKDGNRVVPFQEAFDLSSVANIPVSAVHAPLLHDYSCNIEDLITINFELLTECFKLTDFFGQMQRKPVLLVVHSELSYTVKTLNSRLYQDILSALSSLLIEYRWVDLAIENVSPINDKPVFRFCNNAVPGDVKLVDSIRYDLCTTRVGSVLDVCHSGMTEKLIKTLHVVDKSPIYDPELCAQEEFFRCYRDSIKLIHLADFKELGQKENHGLPFDESSKDKLRQWLQLYKDYVYSCPITIEVREDDYIRNPNYRKTKEVLDDLLEEL